MIDNQHNTESIVHEAVTRLLSNESLHSVGRDTADCRPLPSQTAVSEITDLTRAVVFPGYFGQGDFNRLNLPYAIGINVERLSRLLPQQIEAAFYMASPESTCGNAPAGNALRTRAHEITDKFISELPLLRERLAMDAEAVYRGDPAAVSVAEVIYSYPAIRAIANYRIANALHLLSVPIIPRMICEKAHRETGIDIHPGATIGDSFMIDHGTGVVIGETTIIGNRVKIYQGVTLGARSFPTDDNNNAVKGLARHPIIGDDVVIYANATILGRVTIGAGSTIGGNMWITYDVAPGSVVVQSKQ